MDLLINSINDPAKATQAKELAKSFLVALLSNYESLMLQTWEVTKHYADMENKILKDP